ncbi:hypothetical protein MBLNU230_g8177t1 [Neophaeotheca triangularis]
MLSQYLSAAPLLLLASTANAFPSNRPANYKSPAHDGTTLTQRWETAQSRAADFVSQMTLEEVANITQGISETQGCGGLTGSVPRLNWPGMCLNDGPAGVRGTEFVNGYPAGIHAAASFNKVLALERGQFMGAEFRAKGVDTALSVAVGPLGRVARGGRNWEGFGHDPYLQGQMAALMVEGMQESVVANVKHWIGNEQELYRNPVVENNVSIPSFNSLISDTDIHEVYGWPFADCIHAGAASVMGAYQQVNGEYASENDRILNEILKEEMDFRGFVTSDWGSQKTGWTSARNGLDMAMPSSVGLWDVELVPSVENGTLPEARLRNMGERILAAWYFTNLDSVEIAPGGGMIADFQAPHPGVEARDPKARRSLLQAAEEGHVLVKNTNNALPLKSPRILSLYGYDAVAPLRYNIPENGFTGWNFGTTSLNRSDSELFGLLFQGFAYPQAGTEGTLWVGGGSGANSPAYVSTPFAAVSARAEQDGTVLFWDFNKTEVNPRVNAETDACLVFLNDFSAEGNDRLGLADPYSDELVGNVAANCSNTIVITHNAGVRTLDFADNENVTAIIMAHLPGQDSGRALTNILYGDANPSGKLPYTIPYEESDFGPILAPVVTPATAPEDNLSEPRELDYQYFQATSTTPRYHFGYGLSYTSFDYTNFQANWAVDAPPASPPNPDAVIPGGVASLYDTVATAKLSLTNSGSCSGAEVAQLYLRRPGDKEGVWMLRGFEKVFLEVGESKEVEMVLRRKDLSSWDEEGQEWVLERGTFELGVGRSAEIGGWEFRGTLEV